MIRELEFVVAPEHAGLRLDRMLVRRLGSVSRSMAEAAVGRGDVLVNGRGARKGQKPAAGDRVRVLRLHEAGDAFVRADPGVELRVLFNDGVVLALDKPAGLPVFPLAPDETGALANGLACRFPEALGIGPDPAMPSIVHRLDTDTSGVVLAALTQSAYAALREMLRGRRIGKLYLALVCGCVAHGGRLDHRLVHERVRPCKMRVLGSDEDAGSRRPMRASLAFSVVERFDGFTLLRVLLETGVTHQIRCQLAHVGHPVAGDRLYGAAAAGQVSPPGLTRQFLHAAEAEFVHPVTGADMRVCAPLPSDLALVLDALRS